MPLVVHASSLPMHRVSSPDGNHIGLGGSQGKVFVYKANSLRLVHRDTPQGLAVTSLVFAQHASGLHIVTGSADRTIATVRVQSGVGTQLPRPHRGGPITMLTVCGLQACQHSQRCSWRWSCSCFVLLRSGAMRVCWGRMSCEYQLPCVGRNIDMYAYTLVYVVDFRAAYVCARLARRPLRDAAIGLVRHVVPPSSPMPPPSVPNPMAIVAKAKLARAELGRLVACCGRMPSRVLRRPRTLARGGGPRRVGRALRSAPLLRATVKLARATAGKLPPARGPRNGAAMRRLPARRPPRVEEVPGRPRLCALVREAGPTDWRAPRA